MTQIQTWPHITGIAILDIALVAIIIYQLLMLIRGTRAAPMLVGVAALAMAFYLARIGDLPTLNWLLRHASSLCGLRVDRSLPS